MFETERLILRRFVKGDAVDVYEYLSEPTVNCFAYMKVNSLQEAENVVANRYADKAGEYFAICLKDTGKVIGEIFDCPEEFEQDTFSPC